VLNLLEKLHALAVSNKVRLWHYSGKKEGQAFCYWLESDIAAGIDKPVWFDTLDELVEGAYVVIDPMQLALPEFKTPPLPPLPL
jgi:hypothetical protein